MAMRLFYISLLCGAIVNAASNLNFTDDSWSGIVTGQPFELTWEGNAGNVNITLVNGTEHKPNVVNTIATNISSNSYSWTPGTFAVPGKKFFLMLTDSRGAKSFGDQFEVAEPASSTTSATTSSTAKPNPTASETSTTASSTESSSATSSPEDPQETKQEKDEKENVKLIIGLSVSLGLLCTAGVTLIVMALGYSKKKKKKGGEGGDDVGAGGTDGASDARPAEERRFFGFWSRKVEGKRYTGVARVHELQANDGPVCKSWMAWRGMSCNNNRWCV